MLDPYITRAAGIALLGGTFNTIWISDGGRLGVMDGGISLSAAIPPGFTAVDLLAKPVLNLRFDELSAGFRYTCGSSYSGNDFLCWGQRGDQQLYASGAGANVAGIGKEHVCYQVSSVPHQPVGGYVARTGGQSAYIPYVGDSSC